MPKLEKRREGWIDRILRRLFFAEKPEPLWDPEARRRVAQDDPTTTLPPPSREEG